MKRTTLAEIEILLKGLEYRVNKLEQHQNKHSILVGTRDYFYNFLPKIRLIDGGLQITTK